MSKGTNRRNFLSQAVLGAAGVGAAVSLEERILLASLQDDEGAGEVAPQEAEKPDGFPKGKIGDLKMSRMLMGGNLIGGWAHARDLLYVSELFKAYNTQEKVFETLELGEKRGIDTIQIDPSCQEVVEKYKRTRGSKLQTMVCMRPNEDVEKMRDEVRRLTDLGATTLYTHGHFTDMCARADDVETLGKALDLIREEGLLAGIGGHSLKNVVLSEENDLDPDYYVKTLHTDRYWSAIPEDKRKEFCWQKGPQPDHDQYHDNMYCLNPKETIEYMGKVKKPWVAFKVLAAGAIPTRFGFSHAFRNGADFIIVGMFDFQVDENVDLAARVITRAQRRRERAWFA